MQLATDTSAFMSFAKSGGASGDLTMLPSYGQTASDLLVNSEDGAGLLVNGGGFGPGLVNTILDYGNSDPMATQATMFGRVRDEWRGRSGYLPGGESRLFGNVVVNLGQWYTTNTSSEGGPTENILSGEGTNIFFNNGFIQTAFHQGAEYTSFQSDRFYNGDDPTNLDSFQQFGDLLPYQTSGTGWLSMVDNEANDATQIFADYYGTSDPTNFQSYLAVDANFANTASDVLLIGGIEDTNNIYGSTGIVVNKLNTTTGAGILGDRHPGRYRQWQ